MRNSSSNAEQQKQLLHVDVSSDSSTASKHVTGKQHRVEQGWLWNFVGCVSNLANAAIGPGTLALPYAFAQTGLGLGLLLSILFAIMLGCTLYILAAASAKYGTDSYQSTVEAGLGKRAGLVICASIYLFLFGVCVVFMNVIGDQLTPLAGHILGSAAADAPRELIILAVALFAILPLCLLQSLHYLSFTSVLAVVSMLYLELTIVVRASVAMADGNAASSVQWFQFGTGVFKAIPVLCYALQCHVLCVPVYASLQGRALGRMKWVIALCMVVCLALYVPSGIGGYFLVGANAPGDILTALPDTAWDVNVARLCVTFTVVFSYPLLHFVTRTVVADLLFNGKPLSFRGIALESVLFVGATYGLSAAIPKIQVVLGFTGSTAAIAQIFVFPGLLYRKLHSGSSTDSAIGWGIIAFGVCIGVVSTIVLAVAL